MRTDDGPRLLSRFHLFNSVITRKCKRKRKVRNFSDESNAVAPQLAA